MGGEHDELQMAIAKHFARRVRERGTKDEAETRGDEIYSGKLDGFSFGADEPVAGAGIPALTESAKLLPDDEMTVVDTEETDGEDFDTPEKAYAHALARLETASRTFERAGREFHRKRARLASLPFPWIAPVMRLLMAACSAWIIISLGKGVQEAGPEASLIAGTDFAAIVLPVAMAWLAQIGGEGAGKAISSWLTGSGFWSAAASVLGFLFHLALFLVLELATLMADFPAMGLWGKDLALLMAGVFTVSFAVLPWIGGSRNDPASLYRAMQAAHERQNAAHAEALEAMRQLDLVHAGRKQAAAASLNRSWGRGR